MGAMLADSGGHTFRVGIEHLGNRSRCSVAFLSRRRRHVFADSGDAAAGIFADAQSASLEYTAAITGCVQFADN